MRKGGEVGGVTGVSQPDDVYILCWHPRATLWRRRHGIRGI